LLLLLDPEDEDVEVEDGEGSVAGSDPLNDDGDPCPTISVVATSASSYLSSFLVVTP